MFSTRGLQKQENNAYSLVKVQSFHPLDGSFQLQRALASLPLLCPFWPIGPICPATWNGERPAFFKCGKEDHSHLTTHYADFYVCVDTRKWVLQKNYPFLHLFPHLHENSSQNTTTPVFCSETLSTTRRRHMPIPVDLPSTSHERSEEKAVRSQ